MSTLKYEAKDLDLYTGNIPIMLGDKLIAKVNNRQDAERIARLLNAEASVMRALLEAEEGCDEHYDGPGPGQWLGSVLSSVSNALYMLTGKTYQERPRDWDRAESGEIYTILSKGGFMVKPAKENAWAFARDKIAGTLALVSQSLPESAPFTILCLKEVDAEEEAVIRAEAIVTEVTL